GIFVKGAHKDLQITGNIVWRGDHAAIQFEDLATSSERILVANNTLMKAQCAIRVWDNTPHKELRKGQVEFRNNLLFDLVHSDISFWLGGQGVTGSASRDRGTRAASLWRFGQNWRDLPPDEVLVPLDPQDRKLDKLELLSQEPSNEDFVRPAPGS